MDVSGVLALVLVGMVLDALLVFPFLAFVCLVLAVVDVVRRRAERGRRRATLAALEQPRQW